MGKLKQLNAEGVTDLHSYTVGVEDGQNNIIKIIQDMAERYNEVSPVSPLGLYPFRELLREIDKSSAVNKSTHA